MTRVKAGALIALVGALLVFVGVFGFFGRCAVPGVSCPSPSPNAISTYVGLFALLVGVVLLISSGWRGNLASSALAAIATIPATWRVYELVRQGGCPMIADPAVADACLRAYGEMTAPVLSSAVAAVVLLVGLIRWRHLRRRDRVGAGPRVTLRDVD